MLAAVRLVDFGVVVLSSNLGSSQFPEHVNMRSSVVIAVLF